MHKKDWTNGNVMDVSNIMPSVEVEYASGSRVLEKLLL